MRRRTPGRHNMAWLKCQANAFGLPAAKLQAVQTTCSHIAPLMCATLRQTLIVKIISSENCFFPNMPMLPTSMLADKLN